MVFATEFLREFSILVTMSQVEVSRNVVFNPIPSGSFPLSFPIQGYRIVLFPFPSHPHWLFPFPVAPIPVP